MKKLSIVVLALIMTGCAVSPSLSPIVTSQAYANAESACQGHNGVRAVNQSIFVKYTASCNDGYKTEI